MTGAEKARYEARSQPGDVIVVRPDGWKWGKAERLPDFVVVKAPELSMAEAKKYEESLIDLHSGDLVRVRKYNIFPAVIATAVEQAKDSISLVKTVESIATKSGLATEISPPVIATRL